MNERPFSLADPVVEAEVVQVAKTILRIFLTELPGISTSSLVLGLCALQGAVALGGSPPSATSEHHQALLEFSPMSMISMAPDLVVKISRAFDEELAAHQEALTSHTWMPTDGGVH